MYKNYDIIEKYNQKFEVTYRKTKKIIYASTYINGKLIEKYGTDIDSAYSALEIAIYQEIEFKL